jgi:hypothetical protein
MAGDLDWSYEIQSRDMNFNNRYVNDKEKLLLRTHKWIFGNTPPAIKE